MKKISRFLFLFFLLQFISFSSFADIVEMKNGSKLVGEIISFSKGQLILATDFAGQLTIKADKIKSLTSNNIVLIETEDGNVIRTALVADKESTYKAQYSEESGYFSLNDIPIRRIFSGNTIEDRLIGEPVAIDKKSPWTFKFGLNFYKWEGVTDKISFANSFEMQYLENNNMFKLYYNAGFSDAVDSDEEYYARLGLDSEYHLSRDINVYGRDVVYTDQDYDLKYYNTLALGIGHYVFRKKATDSEISLRLRCGIGHTYKCYDYSEDSSEMNLDTGIYFYYRKEKYTFSTEIIWEPEFRDFADYRIYHESKVEFPLGLLRNMSLQLGINQEYLSVREEDENLDTLLYSRLMFTW